MITVMQFYTGRLEPVTGAARDEWEMPVDDWVPDVRVGVRIMAVSGSEIRPAPPHVMHGQVIWERTSWAWSSLPRRGEIAGETRLIPRLLGHKVIGQRFFAATALDRKVEVSSVAKGGGDERVHYIEPDLDDANRRFAFGRAEFGHGDDGEITVMLSWKVDGDDEREIRLVLPDVSTWRVYGDSE